MQRLIESHGGNDEFSQLLDEDNKMIKHELMAMKVSGRLVHGTKMT